MTKTEVLSDAIVQRLANSSRRYSGGYVRGGILELLSETGASPEEVRAFWESPLENLGPFSDLPHEARKDLQDSAILFFREFRLISHPLIRFLAHGPVARFGGVLVHWGWSLRARGWTGAGNFLLRAARRLLRDCLNLAKLVLSIIRFSSIYETPFAAGLWGYCGCDVFWIIEEYLEGIPIDRDVSPVFLEPSGNEEAALLIGVDALKKEDSLFFLESNMNLGMRPGMEVFFDGREPIGSRLVEYASLQGHETVEYFARNVVSMEEEKCFPTELETSWADLATEAGIELSIVDAPNLGSPRNRMRSFFPSFPKRNILVVYGRDVPSPISRILGTKGRVEQLLRGFKAEGLDSDSVRLPTEIRDSADLPPVAAETRFPNLIVKQRDIDRCEGISLYKVDKIPEGIDWDVSSANEFLVSDLVETEEEGKIREHVTHFRLYLLLTAGGPFYLGARKNISGDPVPESLGWGKVDDVAPFLSNLNLGGWFEAPSPTENQLCEAFALEVGRCLLGFLRKRQVSDLTIEAPAEPGDNRPRGGKGVSWFAR